MRPTDNVFCSVRRKHFKTSLNIKCPHVRESTKLFFWGGEGGGGVGRIPESWDLESKIPRKIEIQNPSSTDKDLESSTEYLELGIHGVDSRIQDCIGSLA